MDKPRHDLPTLHRPVTLEENNGIDRYDDLSRQLRPVPTPPHKHRPHTSMSYSYRGRKCEQLGTLPTMLTDTNWRTRRAKRVNEELPDYSEFDTSYDDLSTKKAYRYPHPGAPKGRQGCIGGTWRHAKEAIGYGPGRLMWIDGIVTLYDDWTLNHEKPWSGRNALHSSRDKMANMGNSQAPTRRFVPLRNAVPVIDRSHRWYSSNQPQPLHPSTQQLNKSAGLGKYKGFYSMAQAYS